MKKVVIMLCVFGLLGASSAYAQSKKEIIAGQQTQIKQQQAQIDSLRVANAYLQGYQDQLAGQVAHLDSANAQLSRQTLQFQHQIDSLNLVQTVLRQTIEQQAQALEEQQARANKLQQEQNRQKKAQAQQKKAQQEKENQEFQQMLAEYRKGCAQSEANLQQFFDKDSHGVNQFSQTKTALLETYENKCATGTISSVDEVKWEVQKTESKAIKACPGYIFENKYTFLVICPNGRSYEAYNICFQTAASAEHNYTAPQPRSLPVHAYVPCQEQAIRLMHSGYVGGGYRRR